MLFGDVPLASWKPRDGSAGEGPWENFDVARAALAQNDTNTAVVALRRVAGSNDVEPRQYLQAWHFLRQLGVQPGPAEGKRVRGVILEVSLEGGLDTLAAYDDGNARYINHGGNLIVWETAADPEIGGLIRALIAEGQRVAELIGPWEEARRPAPPTHHIRLNMLTASGLHFGEGPMAGLSTDPKGGPLIHAGTRLMQALIARAQARR
jgi:hypothetical protein